MKNNRSAATKAGQSGKLPSERYNLVMATFTGLFHLAWNGRNDGAIGVLQGGAVDLPDDDLGEIITHVKNS